MKARFLLSLSGQDGRRAHESKDKEDFNSFDDRPHADKQMDGIVRNRRNAGSIRDVSKAFTE